MLLQSKRSTGLSPEFRQLLKDGKVKNDAQFEMVRQKLLQTQHPIAINELENIHKHDKSANKLSSHVKEKTEDNKIERKDMEMEVLTMAQHEMEEAYIAAIEESELQAVSELITCDHNTHIFRVSNSIAIVLSHFREFTIGMLSTNGAWFEYVIRNVYKFVSYKYCAVCPQERKRSVERCTNVCRSSYVKSTVKDQTKS